MKNGIYKVNEYNKIMEGKYHEDCKKYDPNIGGFPQIAFYIFDKKTGFVKVTEESHHWYKTKKEIKD